MAQRASSRSIARNDADPAARQRRFGDEFRAQARTRRFVREDDDHTRSTPDPTPDRLSHDQAASVAELSRMADRVIEARDVAAAQRARADRAERELRAVGDRLLAARGLVHEAQRVAQLAAERTAYLEGRCESLERALDMALNASVLQRWKWRRSRRPDG